MKNQKALNNSYKLAEEIWSNIIDDLQKADYVDVKSWRDF